jgi:putative ABC transport system permease protein
MELGPIFRALMHNKSRFWLIALEVALTLAIVTNCINVMLDMRSEFLKPSGMDEDNLLVVFTEPFAAEFKEEEFVDALRDEDLLRLRSFPGVAEASGFHQIPLSGSGSASSRRPAGSELDTTVAPLFIVTDRALQTLDVDLIEGRDFTAADFDFDMEAYEQGDAVRNVILNQALAQKLFPDESAVGKVIQNDSSDRAETVIGVVGTLLNSWPSSRYGEDAMLLPGKPGNEYRMRYIVRTEPGASGSAYAELEGLMRDTEPGRVITIRTMEEVKRRQFVMNLALIKILTVVIFLLVAVTSIGIIGLTSFSVTERTRQIGTRRALGATRVDIVRHFLVENWMITGFGLALGLVLTIGLNIALTNAADAPKMDWYLLVGGPVLLWATGIVAALLPAIRASKVAPEIATRTV